MIKLNIGCASNKREGFINIDINESHNPDVVCDAMDLPYDDSSVDYIAANMIVEHLPDRVAFMDECFRVLKKGGILRMTTPYYTHKASFQDPTHKNFTTFKTFNYFCKGCKEYRETKYTKTPFAKIRKKMLFPSWVFKPVEIFANIFPNFYEHSFFPYLFPVGRMIVEMEKAGTALIMVKIDNQKTGEG